MPNGVVIKICFFFLIDRSTNSVHVLKHFPTVFFSISSWKHNKYNKIHVAFDEYRCRERKSWRMNKIRI